MILSSQFGYALRHSMTYNRKSKPGNLHIWSSHHGSVLTPDPIKNGNSAWLEFWSMLWRQGSIYESNHVDFALINDNDLFSLFAAIQIVKAGNGCSFKNEAGRLISFSQEKVTDKADEVIIIKIDHKPETGIMTRKEIDEL